MSPPPPADVRITNIGLGATTGEANAAFKELFCHLLSFKTLPKAACSYYGHSMQRFHPPYLNLLFAAIEGVDLVAQDLVREARKRIDKRKARSGRG